MFNPYKLFIPRTNTININNCHPTTFQKVLRDLNNRSLIGTAYILKHLNIRRAFGVYIITPVNPLDGWRVQELFRLLPFPSHN